MMGNGYEVNGWGTWHTPDPMPDSVHPALLAFERAYQEDDSDPHWEAEQAVREDAAVMAEQLGTDGMADLWAAIHGLIQDPLPEGDRTLALADRFVEVRDLFDRWVGFAADAMEEKARIRAQRGF